MKFSKRDQKCLWKKDENVQNKVHLHTHTDRHECTLIHGYTVTFIQHKNQMQMNERTKN